mgnify:CR=1 FL=1
MRVIEVDRAAAPIRIGAMRRESGCDDGGREQLLIQNQRDTITGTREQVYLMAGSEVTASYRPKQGSQKLVISSDCSALSRGSHSVS